MVRKRAKVYYERLEKMAALLEEGAQTLCTIAQNSARGRLPEQQQKITELRKASGTLREEMLETLLAEFIPPMEPEDLLRLANCMDAALGWMERTVSAFALFRVYQLSGAAPCLQAVSRC